MNIDDIMGTEIICSNCKKYFILKTFRNLSLGKNPREIKCNYCDKKYTVSLHCDDNGDIIIIYYWNKFEEVMCYLFERSYFKW